MDNKNKVIVVCHDESGNLYVGDSSSDFTASELREIIVELVKLTKYAPED